MADTRLAELIYRKYADYWDHAQQERRWNPYRDVPWNAINPDTNENLILNAETFMCVESYLPDYVGKGMQILREVFGQAWFHANWAYEESRHSIALMEYLLRSGRRTPEQMFDLQAQLMSKPWDPPFDTARRMTIYGSIQEMATFVIYTRQEARAAKEGDEALRTVYRLNARDEIAHAHFYEDIVKVLLEQDREGTLADIAHVAKNFQMPGVGIVPNYDARIEVMRGEGRIDRDVFFQKVLFPLLKFVGVTRAELVTASHAMKVAGAGAAANGG